VKISEAAAHVAHKAGSNRGMTNAEAEFAPEPLLLLPGEKKSSTPMLLGGYFVGLLYFTWKINSCYTQKHKNEAFFFHVSS